jgi:hypothetical protein
MIPNHVVIQSAANAAWFITQQNFILPIISKPPEK